MIVTPLLRDYLLEQAIDQHNLAEAALYHESTWENVSVLQLNKENTCWVFIITIDRIGMFDVEYNETDFKNTFSNWSLI